MKLLVTAYIFFINGVLLESGTIFRIFRTIKFLFCSTSCISDVSNITRYSDFNSMQSGKCQCYMVITNLDQFYTE